EAAGRGADVERVRAGDVEAERLQRVRELLPAARDVRRRALDLELRFGVDLLSRLRVAGDEAGEDECLRLRLALSEPALDEERVEPLLHGPKASRLASERRYWQEHPQISVPLSERPPT